LKLTSFFAVLAIGFLGGCQVGTVYNVRNFGAIGDGRALDTPAINHAIDAAAAAGGGTVRLPAGTYLCYSIHLKSNITLYLDSGATILAAGTAYKGEYDPPEPNVFDRYQDFGHTHWHNSLIWGEGIHDVSILGPGLIYGKGLSRGDGPPSTQPTTQPRHRRRRREPGQPEDMDVEEWIATTMPSLYDQDDRASTMLNVRPTTEPTYPSRRDTLPAGVGNKAIALKWCHNVTLRDISILQGGHFGILATGVDNFTLDNLKIDTNRDGMDIDACRDVRVSNCSINSPNDDGLCLKSSYGLGVARATENVTITNCYVTGGYVVGALLDGTFRKHLGDWEPGFGGGPPSTPPSTRPTTRPSHPGRTGRIKFGTESNGGFKNITISNCVLDDCQGLALETVDGGPIENVTIDNLTMRDIVSVPIFIRLGARARGPFAPIGTVRHVIISNIICENVASRYACIISGVAGHPIEDVRISNVRIAYPGDAFHFDATTRPAEMAKSYPEPTMFRAIPAYGFYIRHVNQIELDNVKLSTARDDTRPPFFLEDVDGADFFNVKAPHAADVPTFKLNQVKDFSVRLSPGIPDTSRDSVEEDQF
jgi:polygalacturonase